MAVVLIILLFVVLPIVLGMVFFFWIINWATNTAANNNPTQSAIVTQFELSSVNNVCGLNGANEPGVRLSPGGIVSISWTIYNPNSTSSCAIHAMSADPASGFSVSNTNLPITIPASGTTGLDFSLNAPGNSYDGVLIMTLS